VPSPTVLPIRQPLIVLGAELGSRKPRLSTPLSSSQNYSVMSKIIHLTSGELTLQINKGAMQHWVGQPRLSGGAWAE
jgi:hypothetical protein